MSRQNDDSELQDEAMAAATTGGPDAEGLAYPAGEEEEPAERAGEGADDRGPEDIPTKD